jgi:hypothetical protein
MQDKHKKSEEEKIPTTFVVKIVLFFGFFLQLIIAFITFVVLSAFNLFDLWGENMALTFELLLSFMPAISLGFILSNFIVHRIPILRNQLDADSSYQDTQRLLFKLLLLTFVFIAISGAAIVGLQSVM